MGYETAEVGSGWGECWCVCWRKLEEVGTRGGVEVKMMLCGNEVCEIECIIGALGCIYMYWGGLG